MFLHSRNFQNRSKTELWMPSLVLIVSALFAMTSKIGQIAMVRPATRKTGTSEVITCAVSGLRSIKFRNGVINSAMLLSEDNAQSSETGKICNQLDDLASR